MIDDDTLLERPRGGMFRWYYLASAFFLLQTIGALSIVDRFVYGEWSNKGGDKLTQIFNLLQIFVAIALFWRGYKKVRDIGTGGRLALLLMGFLFLSFMWSIDPQTTLRRAIIYLFFMLGAIGISTNFDGDEYMNLLRTVLIFVVVVSLGLRVVSPGNVLMGDGTLRGFFTHKNVMGQVMAAGVLVSLHGLRVGSGRRWLGLASIGMFTFATLAAKSGTSLMTIVLFCGVDRLAALLGRGGAARMVGIVLIVIGVPIFAILAMSPELLLTALGKDPTLTGRTELWPLVIDNIWVKPMLGWGFSAFWSPFNQAAVEISDGLGWVVPEAHNGLLELLLEVGVVGTVLFLSIFLRNVAIAVRCLRTPASGLAVSLLMCCLGILLVGMTEEVLVDPAQISVSILFIGGLICERTLRAAHDDAYADAEVLYDEPVY